MGLFNKNYPKDNEVQDSKETKNITTLEKDNTDNIEVSDTDDSENKEHADSEILQTDDMFDTGDEKIEDRSINECIDEVLDYFTTVDPIKLNMLERGKIKKDSFEQEVHNYIKRKITSNQEKHDEIFKGFASFIWSYDVIDELIENRDISDIKIYNWDRVRIKKLGKRSTSEVKFRNEKHYLKFVEHVAIKNRISISDQNAAQNFTDKESSPTAILRFNIVTGFLNSNKLPVVHIRKIPKIKYTREELIKFGFFDAETADILEEKAKNGEGMLFIGKGASGKTTAMNYCIDFIPEENSGLAIQENEELFSDHPDIAFEHTVTNRGEGKIEYNLGDLARNGLLTDIDYFIIGEIKGAEAVYLLNAVYTGAKGWASVHGASATEGMKKLVDYIKYNSDYTQAEALQMLVHLNTVIFMENFHVKEIAEVVGYDEEKKNLIYKMIK